jgi:Sec-independent protein translocase protein TatA
VKRRSSGARRPDFEDSVASALSILEIGIILLVALVVIGPEKMPEVLVAVGRVMRELRLASNTVLRELTSTVDDLPEVMRPYRPSDAQHTPSAKTPQISSTAEASAGPDQNKTPPAQP